MEKSWRTVLASALVAAAAAAALAFTACRRRGGWPATPPPLPATPRPDPERGQPSGHQVLKDPSDCPETLPGSVLAAEVTPSARGYHLLLRDAPIIGPNAFALPDGRIVVTDQLIRWRR